jgi:hypothetical protein
MTRHGHLEFMDIEELWARSGSTRDGYVDLSAFYLFT